MSPALVKAAIDYNINSIVLQTYPIGSIYMSVNSTDPGTLFGGTWTRIQGRFLLAAGDGYAAGSTGVGSKTIDGLIASEKKYYASMSLASYNNNISATTILYLINATTSGGNELSINYDNNTLCNMQSTLFSVNTEGSASSLAGQFLIKFYKIV